MTNPKPNDTPVAGQEKETLVAFLDYQRGIMLRKTDGLDDEQLRRPMTPSGLCLLGVVKHLASVERWWFRACFAGEEVEFVWTDEDPDADFRIEPTDTTDAILSLYRQECETANAVIDRASLDDLATTAHRRGHVSMRWILLHMIEEVARHLGHADLMREQIDGATGD